MRPTLLPGDVVLCDPRAYRRAPPEPGDIVLARDPRMPARRIVKRVVARDAEGRIELRGDAPAHSTDSRRFGAIDPALVIGRITCRLGRA